VINIYIYIYIYIYFSHISQWFIWTRDTTFNLHLCVSGGYFLFMYKCPFRMCLVQGIGDWGGGHPILRCLVASCPPPQKLGEADPAETGQTTLAHHALLTLWVMPSDPSPLLTNRKLGSSHPSYHTTNWNHLIPIPNNRDGPIPSHLALEPNISLDGTRTLCWVWRKYSCWI